VHSVLILKFIDRILGHVDELSVMRVAPLYYGAADNHCAPAVGAPKRGKLYWNLGIYYTLSIQLYGSLPDSVRSRQAHPTVRTTSDWSRGYIRPDGWLSCIASAQLLLSGSAKIGETAIPFPSVHWPASTSCRRP